MNSDRVDTSEILKEGMMAYQSGRPLEAEASYRRVLAVNPLDPDALNLLGVLVCDAGNAEEGVGLIRRAVDLKPMVPGYHLNLGMALRQAGRIEESVDALGRGLRIQPASADGHYAMAQSLQRLNRYREAEGAYREARRLAPEHRGAWRGLVRTIDLCGRVDEANQEYQAYLDAYPDDDGMRLRWATLLPAMPVSTEAIAQWRARLQLELEALLARPLRVADPLNDVGRTLFFLSYHGLGNRSLMELAARVALHACPELAWEAPFCARWRGPGPRIRVGFISRFFKEHSIGKTSAGLVERLSRERFEVVALFVPPVVQDTVSDFIRERADQTVMLPNSLSDAREAIAALNLDVLFYQDIGMEPFTYYLAFSRLAPVQCVSFGHPDTTGIPAMDYFVSNDLYERESAQAEYSEQLFLLRHLPTLAYYYRPQLPHPLFGRADFGLPTEGRLYLCPQTLFKLHPDFDDILIGILDRDAEARLVLIEALSQDWLRLLLGRLHSRRPGCLERVLVVQGQPREMFLNLLAVSDVVLDPPHFNGMNTSLEALAAGAPVVTLPGSLHRTRHTQAMYRCMGMDDLIVGSPAEYVDTAVKVAGDRRWRDTLRQRILAANAVLFENDAVVREFERFFTTAVASRAANPG